MPPRCSGTRARPPRNTGCYRKMPTARAKKEGALRFCERAGFNRNDKTAFIKWLDEKNVTE